MTTVADKRIEISKFTFWVICTIGGALITGSGAWAWSMSERLTKNQVDMGKALTMIENLDKRVEENLELSKTVIELTSQVQILQAQCDNNARQLNSKNGVWFDMPDYEKYVKPPIDSLLDRVTRLEVKNE